MSRYMLLIVIALATGCTTTKTRQCPPVETRFVDRPVKVYVEIDKDLTEIVPWERGVTPDKSIEAAKKRGEVAEQYERQLKAIEQVQGKAVP